MATDDPMMASVAGRYASALFDLANEQRKLPEVEGHLTQVEAMLRESADLRQMVRSPVLAADEQAKALAAVLAKAGIGGLAANFLGLVARNRRLFVLPDMLTSFRKLAARHRGEVTADVTSAVALNEAQLIQLGDMLKASVGKDVRMVTAVDPALLGGLVVKIGSRMIDGSIRTKLSNLRMRMKEVG